MPRLAWRGGIHPSTRPNDESATPSAIGYAIRDELNGIPRFDRPGRTYYLLQGALRSATDLRHPDSDDWRNPDLFWPDDRRWFVATDVDFWSLYIGGGSSFIADLADAVPTHSELVELDLPLEIED